MASKHPGEEDDPPNFHDDQDPTDNNEQAIEEGESDDQGEPVDQGESVDQQQAGGSESTDRKQIKVVQRAEASVDGKQGRIISTETFATLSSKLRTKLDQRKRDGENMAWEIQNLDGFKQDVKAKKAAFDQATRQDRIAGARNRQSDNTKAAQREWKEAKSLSERLGRKLKERGMVKIRAQESENFTFAQGRLEDFLYYQNPVNRRRREEHAIMVDRHLQRRPYLLPTDKSGYFDWMRAVLNSYDDQGIGVAGDRDGDGDERRTAVEPHELHYWTQPARRGLVGLGSNIRAPQRFNLRLVHNTIEETRMKVEKRRHPDDPLYVLAHDRRRRNEQQRFGRGTARRPTTSNVRVETVNENYATVDYFRKIQTKSGLFIAAKESSWDWLTSYDCLGKVKTVDVPEVFPESNEPDEDNWIFGQPPGDDDGKLSLSMGLEKPGSDAGQRSHASEGEEERNELIRPKENVDSPKRVVPSRAAKNKKKEGETTIGAKNKGQEPTGGAKAPVKSKQTGKKKVPPEKKEIDKEDEDASEHSGWENVRAQIDVPYLKSEFTRASRGLRLGERRYQVTSWAEETTGRRERHDYKFILPSSPIYSPPCPPLQPNTIDDGDIPAGFSLSDTNPIPLEVGGRQKCPINPGRCRAWWNPHHSAEDCWIAYPEQPTRPDDPIRWPILEIDAPKGSSDDYFTADGRNIYRSRLHDHYGLVHQPKSEQHGHPWPRIGVRVPYEPMTFDDMRLGALSGDAVATSNIEKPRHGEGKGKQSHPTLAELRETKRPAEEDENHEHLEGRPAKKSKTVHEHIDTADENICAKDTSLRMAHEMRSLAVPIVEAETHWGWFPGDDGGPPPESPKESEDEGDLFKQAYENLSFPEGRPAPPQDSRGKPPKGTHAPCGASGTEATAGTKIAKDAPPKKSSHLPTGPSVDSTKEPTKESIKEPGTGPKNWPHGSPDRAPGKKTSGVTAPAQEPGFLTTAEEDEFNLEATEEGVRQKYYGNKPAKASGPATTDTQAPEDLPSQDVGDDDSLYDE